MIDSTPSSCVIFESKLRLSGVFHFLETQLTSKGKVATWVGKNVTPGSPEIWEYGSIGKGDHAVSGYIPGWELTQTTDWCQASNGVVCLIITLNRGLYICQNKTYYLLNVFFKFL